MIELFPLPPKTLAVAEEEANLQAARNHRAAVEGELARIRQARSATWTRQRQIETSAIPAELQLLADFLIDNYGNDAAGTVAPQSFGNLNRLREELEAHKAALAILELREKWQETTSLLAKAEEWRATARELYARADQLASESLERLAQTGVTAEVTLPKVDAMRHEAGQLLTQARNWTQDADQKRRGLRERGVTAPQGLPPAA